ncbi:hypothetical protein CERZMDRAFT_113202 [Cercospora zeae-maydis SCOH1-5]|uniref:Uncharacterized protein n=1 Tax=Cercospora zeae-maydis SCOH1-5 TaxID=717836 RepID=A0A6A6FB75_9PEZI|nr:hypothetical protein CERZMDRAFT_113202 [Cercospora zeae-maydis SCOH1-5]
MFTRWKIRSLIGVSIRSSSIAPHRCTQHVKSMVSYFPDYEIISKRYETISDIEETDDNLRASRPDSPRLFL